MKNEVVAERDLTLETLLNEVERKTSLLNKVVDNGTYQLNNIALVLSPFLRRTFLAEYDVDSKTMLENLTYEFPGPFAHYMKLEKPDDADVISPSMLVNSSLEMININARGASLHDALVLKRPVGGLDVRVNGILKKDPSIFTFARESSRFSIKKIVENSYFQADEKILESTFFATDSSGSEGYLIIRGTLNEKHLKPADFLTLSFSVSKTDDIKNKVSKEPAPRLYEIKESGQVRHQIEQTTEEFDYLVNSLTNLKDRVINGERHSHINSLEVFVNGMKTNLVDLLSDIGFDLYDGAISYLKNVRPKIINGNVQYAAAVPKKDERGMITMQPAKISYTLNEFLERVKRLYNNDKDAAEKDLFGDVGIKPVGKGNFEGMFG
jgi:hypothetical protein